MHELSLCASIAGIVTRHAAGAEVRTVHLRVGALRQVVPATLEFCWPLVVERTPLEGSTLAVEPVPARLRCRDCGGESTVGAVAVLVCPGCGAGDVAVLAGEEFLVTTLDLAPPRAAVGED